MNLFLSIRATRRSRPMFVGCALAFALVSAACVGVSAAATDGPDLRKTTVRYTHDELESDIGARTLYRRLTVAADLVCSQSQPASPFLNVDVKRCRENAVRRAVLQINNPRLTGVLVAMTPVQGVLGEAPLRRLGSRRIGSLGSGG